MQYGLGRIIGAINICRREIGTTTDGKQKYLFMVRAR